MQYTTQLSKDLLIYFTSNLTKPFHVYFKRNADTCRYVLLYQWHSKSYSKSSCCYETLLGMIVSEYYYNCV